MQGERDPAFYALAKAHNVQKETVNPKENLESFDAIHYAALQVFIIATANGVSFSDVFFSTD
jgi:hypothetical protein